MLGRFLKKSRPQDQRSHYRRVPGRGDAIGVKLICSTGQPIAGTLVDLAAGGAAIEFSQDVVDELQLDVVRELVFSSLTSKSFRAWAQVRSLPREGAPNRYGFMFHDSQAIFEQIDDAFYKFFNRRRFRRAKPALGEKIKAEICFSNVAETVTVHDVSLGGAAVIVPEDIAGMLEVDMGVSLTIHVPKTEHSLQHYAIVRHITPGATGIRVGLSMDPGTEAGDSKRRCRKARLALADYIQRRLDEIDRYNSAYH